MSRTLNLDIIETADELKELMHRQTKAKFKERLHALYLLKTEQVHGLQELADLLGRAKSTIVLWLARYRTKGLVGLLEWNYHGGKRPALPESALQALRERLSQPEGFKSYLEIQHWLAAEHGLEIPYKTVHKTVRYKLKAKLKVARPTSIHRDEEAGIKFKKTLPALGDS